ncbi:MAG: outer membrane beta-barrel protein [Saprospiraceae bacterium]
MIRFARTGILGSLLLLAGWLQGQSISFGFQAGLTFSKFLGPLEMDGNTTLESFDFANGFHVGALFNYKLTDQAGIRTGLVFNQKGSKYLYEGPSYFFFSREGAKTPVATLVTRRQEIKFTNAHIDIPLMAFARLGKLEVRGGIYGSLIAAGNAGGSLKLTNIRTLTGNNPVQDINFSLDYNFGTDRVGSGRGDLNSRIINGEEVFFPSIIGAFYEEPTKKGSYFNLLDVGLTGGLSYFINETFYFGAEIQYGLTDVTKNYYDYSKLALDASRERIKRSDKDTGLTLKFSLGFSF